MDAKTIDSILWNQLIVINTLEIDFCLLNHEFCDLVIKKKRKKLKKNFFCLIKKNFGVLFYFEKVFKVLQVCFV